MRGGALALLQAFDDDQTVGLDVHREQAMLEHLYDGVQLAPLRRLLRTWQRAARHAQQALTGHHSDAPASAIGLWP
eukprot:2703377-Pyramimonas_sp.AAC.1